MMVIVEDESDITALIGYLEEEAPDDYAGSYLAEDGQLVVLFTRALDEHGARLAQHFPGVRIELRNASYSLSKLRALARELEAAMQRYQDVVAVGLDERRNLVEVGITDIASSTALSLRRRFASEPVRIYEARISPAHQ